jgi:ribosomal protein S18 acetylase RimI-like enzyme
MWNVVPADSSRWSQALSALFSRLPDEDRELAVGEAMEAAASGELLLDGLFLAERDATAVGAVLSMIQPDGTALVWPPVISPTFEQDSTQAARDDLADGLLAEVCRRIDTAGAWIGQSLLDLEATDDRNTLARNGFEHLADLVFMERSLSDPLPPESPVEFERLTYADSANHQQFARVIEQTYIETRDCPGLNGLRTGAEALSCHRSSGEFDASLWTLYRVDGADVGLLLFNFHPDRDAWEVVYMGIVPEARGQSYGEAMLIHGLHAAHAAGRAAVFLAVDSKNKYARGLYDRLGFIETGTQAVHARGGGGRPVVE